MFQSILANNFVLYCSASLAYPSYRPGSYPHWLIWWFLTASKSERVVLAILLVGSAIPSVDGLQRLAPSALAPVSSSRSAFTKKNNLFFMIGPPNLNP